MIFIYTIAFYAQKIRITNNEPIWGISDYTIKCAMPRLFNSCPLTNKNSIIDQS
jgi:hypothetical protein